MTARRRSGIPALVAIRGRRSRILLLLAVAGLAAGVGVVSVSRVRDQLAALEACEAIRTGDAERALSLTDGRTGADETGRAAAECRCLALVARGSGAACSELMEDVLERTRDEGWAPRPALAVHLVQEWRDAGRTPRAAELARRAALAHPGDPDLFYLELTTRSSVEDEDRVLEELRARFPDGRPPSARMRVSLATRYLVRAEPARALEVLGEMPPDGTPPGDLGRWFETRGMAFALADDVAAVRRTYASWRDAGGDAGELRARYAVTLSIAGIADPEHGPIELLEGALAGVDRSTDRELREALVTRLVLTLVADDRIDDALAVYDAHRGELELAGLSRAELVRSAAHRELERAGGTAVRRGSLRFAIEPSPGGTGAGSPDGLELLVSPEVSAPVDAEYERFAVPASGRLVVERGVGPAPQRWVLRDGAGRVRASGTVHPVAGRATDVAVGLRPPTSPTRMPLVRRPADGHPRVLALLLDCGDWRIVQYLRTRGELPFLDTLVRNGWRAVLESDPPLTAAALEALVWPRRTGRASFVGLVHQLGVELAGLSSIGDNPFSALEWILPESEDLFATLGRGEKSALNLLLSHGGIRAGRHGEMTGPHGSRRRLPLGQSARDLTADERARWPALADVARERDRHHLRVIAAELDTAVEIATGEVSGELGAVDLLALRVEPLDILTHAFFADAVEGGQDDGRRFLFSVYRYLDARLGEAFAASDADDFFLVFSDHGIRTAMEHAETAFFALVGPGVPAGRAAGRPALRGVSRALADLLSVETRWPDTGVAPWAATRRAGADARAPHPSPARPGDGAPHRSGSAPDSPARSPSG